MSSFSSSLLPSQFLLLIVLLFCLFGTNFVGAVFYRNIPFRYKATEGASEEQGGGIIPAQNVEHERNIGELVDQIEEEAMHMAQRKIQMKEAEKEEEMEKAMAPPRRRVRLIPIRREKSSTATRKSQGGRMKNGVPVPIASARSPLHSHMMALRPDYAFRNVATFLRNFFDSRMERHRRRAAKNEGNTEE